MSSSLEFSNLPLIKVEATATFAQPVAVEFDAVCAFRRSFEALMPRVSDFNGGSPLGAPFTLSFGPGQGIGLSSRDGRTSIALRQDRINASWTRQSEEDDYPRFAYIRELMELALRNSPSKLKAIAMSYVNHVPREHGDVLDLLSVSLLPEALREGELLHDINWSYRLANGLDIRWQIQRTSEGFLLTSTGGTSDPGGVDGLDAVHELLINEFSRRITERAKDVWGLNGTA